ncbi:hypothetical protein [Roseinatronobacter sp. NSM]|uniref:hypothetical protein n=1 Tax=Roseinatronobacter sp. NSM TaxID=3457785 RepID=UPI0040370501
MDEYIDYRAGTEADAPLQMRSAFCRRGAGRNAVRCDMSSKRATSIEAISEPPLNEKNRAVRHSFAVTPGATIADKAMRMIVSKTTDRVKLVNTLSSGSSFIAFASVRAEKAPFASPKYLNEALEHLLTFHETVERMVEAGRNGTRGVENACIMHSLRSVLAHGGLTLNRAF